ncbi:galactokinase [Cellulomonas wangsupingiae]|uniref:Galactokinase n=1 Tax=Cellulomonas wangsupingiae TaxID=2968085 RepID=A0ABY5K9V8_9CELL|nr:galactokinase [Cellulomonas wangsupingiae]MCC2335814.1 galactokinase [Cellulomonas wangsupingiae]MCM0639897.1 galactokinase [Cellulomonas wangsupingiae]UUI67064.1 galactokinase [Cellulomonas wangsupingiae]
MTSATWTHAWDRADGERRARDLFTGTFGAAPDGVWSAPGRVNLIGEHTDYNDGLALPIALPHRTYAAVARRTDGLVRLVSAQEPSGVREVPLAEAVPGAVRGWAAYVVGVAWALRAAGHDVGGFDVAIDSCVPFGAGLSSSAALEASVAVALDALHGLGLAGGVDDAGAATDDAGRGVLATLCVRAENEMAGAPTGGMDQAASLRARAGNALLLDCRDGSVRHVPFDLAAHGLALLVVDTRAEHSHVDGEYAQRRAACEAAARRLGVASLREVADDARGDGWALEALTADEDGVLLARRVRHVTSEIGRVTAFVEALDAGDVRAVAPLMDASHASLRDDYEVSCDELDVAVDAARAAGALGARMTGGGFGGSAIALVGVDEVEAVAEGVARAFAARGLRSPAFAVAVAGPPAG